MVGTAPTTAIARGPLRHSAFACLHRPTLRSKPGGSRAGFECFQGVAASFPGDPNVQAARSRLASRILRRDAKLAFRRTIQRALLSGRGPRRSRRVASAAGARPASVARGKATRRGQVAQPKQTGRRPQVGAKSCQGAPLAVFNVFNRLGLPRSPRVKRATVPIDPRNNIVVNHRGALRGEGLVFGFLDYHNLLLSTILFRSSKDGPVSFRGSDRPNRALRRPSPPAANNGTSAALSRAVGALRIGRRGATTSWDVSFSAQRRRGGDARAARA